MQKSFNKILFFPIPSCTEFAKFSNNSFYHISYLEVLAFKIFDVKFSA